MASVGADKIVNFWDLRKTDFPVFQNDDNRQCLLSVDFLQNNKLIVYSSIEGEISMLDTNSE